MDLQVALLLQPLQALAHRCAAHAQTRGDLAFAEAVAGQQTEIEDVLLDLQVHRFR